MEEQKQELWEKLPHEPLRSFKAFQVYRDMGFRRSKPEVAKRMNISLNQVQKYAKKWRWEERVEAWERHLDRVRTETIKEEVKEMTARHIQNALLFQRASLLPVEALLNRIRPEKDPRGENQNFEMLSFDKLYDLVIDAVQTFSKAVDIERKARGEPGEISKLDVNARETIKVILPAIEIPKTDETQNGIENESTN